MPAPVTTSSTTQKARNTTGSKKSRAIRRRGRARGGVESDDEIERALSTDSDSESDNSLSTDFATDSDQGSASEDEFPDRQINSHTPNTSHSSGGLDKDGAVNGNSRGTFFSSTGNWSEMVAEENANGGADLPVIEFSDFKANNSPNSRKPPKKSRKIGKKKAPATTLVPTPLPNPSTSEPTSGDAPETVCEDSQEDIQHLSSHPKRPVGQSARQAYQQKLESDPSFVPKVGGFWGHDDRLMDKDLRSLSGWWRGRWQGRGRGRGIGIASGIGRRRPSAAVQDKEEEENLPPIELPWTHDGFEEMKQKEEQRSEVQRQANISHRGATRGRGGTPATRGAPFRGGSVHTGNRATAAVRAGRVWYVMKPELMWTKQSENFLFFETPKHRAPGSAYRIQLPHSRAQVVKPLLSHQHSRTEGRHHVTAATTSIAGSEIGDQPVVIKLPKREGEEPMSQATTELDDVFKVRPHLVSVEPIPLPAPSNTKSSPPADGPAHLSSSSSANPDPAAKSQLEQLSLDHLSIDPSRAAQTEKAVLRSPVGQPPAENVHKSPDTGTASRRPSLPPIQTVYSPPPTQPSPAYNSSYPYPALPPGIALNQHGVPYELATGRPVFIPSSAPPPMYNPRPIVHSHLPQHSLSYIPQSHVHPSSAISPDFTAHRQPSHSHAPSIRVPVNSFIDPATGVPMFSLPRPSRVEIRAPGEATSKTVTNGGNEFPVSSPQDRGTSHIRDSSTSYVTSLPHPGVEYAYHSYSSSSDVSTLPSYASLPDAGTAPEAGSNTTPQSMVHYPAYQQYYYPDPPYGYSQYMDMSQPGHYEMYPPMETQGTTYY